MEQQHEAKGLILRHEISDFTKGPENTGEAQPGHTGNRIKPSGILNLTFYPKES